MLPRSLCSEYMLSLSWTGEQAGAELVGELGGPGGSWEGWRDEESGKNFSTPLPSHFTTSRIIISNRRLEDVPNSGYAVIFLKLPIGKLWHAIT